ncbi:hypothetical protein ACFFWB_05310 [Flavobacterium procerum]
MGEFVGQAPRRPQQYENFEELKKKTSFEELRMLTDHPNGVVRCYAFWALAHNENVDLFSIVKTHLIDDATIETLFGCTGSVEKVGDVFINIVTPKYFDLNIKKLNEKESKALDSLLIYKNNNLDSRFTAIENVEINELLYPRIRELVTKFHNQSALATLSKYRKENDIQLILKNKGEDKSFFYTYKAIQNFPDSKFFPLLEKNLMQTLDNDHFDYDWRELYKAIATYKNTKAVDLLTIPFTKVKHQNIKKYHIDFIYDAILVNESSLYDDLLWKIWEEENIITLKGFKYLLKTNPSKTYELSKQNLLKNYNGNHENVTPFIDESIFADGLKETMLNFILANERNLAYNIISNQILESDVHDFEMYCKKVLELKETTFVEPLFKRLQTENNPNVYLQIVETLISFKDKDINKRILETRKENKNMNQNWGSDSLDQILEKNNIK